MREIQAFPGRLFIGNVNDVQQIQAGGRLLKKD
jgi:hypothetical protein